MKADYINSFYTATNNVFAMMLGVRIERGNLKMAREVEEGKYIGILVDVKGRLKGCVYYIFPEEVALTMVEHMAGIELEEFDVFVSSTLVEIVDKINNLAKDSLKEHRKRCRLSDPVVVREDLNKVFDRYRNFICIPIESEIGNFNMNIVIN